MQFVYAIRQYSLVIFYMRIARHFLIRDFQPPTYRNCCTPHIMYHKITPYFLIDYLKSDLCMNINILFEFQMLTVLKMALTMTLRSTSRYTITIVSLYGTPYTDK